MCPLCHDARVDTQIITVDVVFSWPSQIISVCWLIVDCKSSLTLTAWERLFIHLQAIFFLLNLICIMEIRLVHVWLVIRYCFKTLIWKLWWLISVITCILDYVIMPQNYVDTQHNYICVKMRHKKYIYRLHVSMTVSHGYYTYDEQYVLINPYKETNIYVQINTFW